MKELIKKNWYFNIVISGLDMKILYLENNFLGTLNYFTQMFHFCIPYKRQKSQMFPDIFSRYKIGILE